MLLVALLVALPAATTNHSFVVHLSGDGEAPPMDALAQGQVTFHLNEDGTELSYRLRESNIVIGSLKTGRLLLMLAFGVSKYVSDLRENLKEKVTEIKNNEVFS